MTPGLWHVSLLSCAHATEGTRTKGQRCASDEVGHSLRWREPPVSLRERPWSSWSRSSRRPRQDARHDPARPVRLRPLSCEQPQPHNEPEGGTNGQQIRAAAGLNGMLRTRGVGRAAGGRPPQAAEGWAVLRVCSRWGAYRHRLATNPTSISISVARSGHLCAKLPAMYRNAPPRSRYATVLVPSQSFDWRQAVTPVLGTACAHPCAPPTLSRACVVLRACASYILASEPLLADQQP